MAAYPPLQAGKNLGVDDAKRNEGPTSITHRAFGLPPVDGKGHIIKAPWSGDQPRQETYTVKDREVQSQTTVPLAEVDRLIAAASKLQVWIIEWLLHPQAKGAGFVEMQAARDEWYAALRVVDALRPLKEQT